MDLLCAERLQDNHATKDEVIFNDNRVLKNLLETECSYTPSCDYFVHVQTEVQPYMRRIVTKWMLEVCEELNCEDQVFPLAVNLFDRYLCCCDTPKKFLQLLAADCVLVASKIRQSATISIETLCYYTSHSVTPCQMKQYELLLVSKLNWDLSSITAYDFVDHILHRVRWSRHEKMIRRHAFTLVHLCYTEIEFMYTKPSTIALACVVSAARGIKMKITESWLYELCLLTRSNASRVEDTVDTIEKIVAQETTVVIQQHQQRLNNKYSKDQTLYSPHISTTTTSTDIYNSASNSDTSSNEESRYNSHDDAHNMY